MSAESRPAAPSSTLEENVRTIKRWERAVEAARSTAERVSDWITRTAASGPVLLLHVVWFTLWLVINTGGVAAIPAFDPYPFSILMLVVALEAIFLALFVLASQNRLTRQADKRAHLNLQIDLLAEREMTAVLQLLQDITRQLDIKTTVTQEQLGDLIKRTDIKRLTQQVEELAEPGEVRQNPRKLP